MLIDWQNSYCENNHVAKSSLQIQSNCNSNQDSHDILRSMVGEKHPKFYLEAQKTLNIQHNHKERNNEIKINIQAVLQSYSDQHSLVLTQRLADQWNKIEESKKLELSNI